MRRLVLFIILEVSGVSDHEARVFRFTESSVISSLRKVSLTSSSEEQEASLRCLMWFVAVLAKLDCKSRLLG